MPLPSRPAVDMPLRCYAIRRVNPFLGVMQVLETSAGRAISTNGVVWDIEVLVDWEQHSAQFNSRENAFYRYGLWSQEDGLVNRPLAPHLDNDPLTRQCNDLIECIEKNLQNLPFELSDQTELWLFDEKGEQLLALLASVSDEKLLPSPEPRYWSASIGAEGVPSQKRFPETRELEQQVKKAAGFNIRKHWIRRRPDSSGVMIHSAKVIDGSLFPAYLISESWRTEEESERVRDYINWIAPSLLTLQSLSVSQRKRLEDYLHVQAISVEHHWHLYPELVSPDALMAARVQSQLQMLNKKPSDE